MNKIVDAEQKATGIRIAAQGETKTAQADAVRQGKELLDKARTAGGDAARVVVTQAQADAQSILSESADEAAKKAQRLKADSQDKILAAARFVSERIVDSV